MGDKATVKIVIDVDEWYPVYTVKNFSKIDDEDEVVKISEFDYKWIIETHERFLKMQEYLRDIINKEPL